MNTQEYQLTNFADQAVSSVTTSLIARSTHRTERDVERLFSCARATTRLIPFSVTTFNQAVNEFPTEAVVASLSMAYNEEKK